MKANSTKDIHPSDAQLLLALDNELELDQVAAISRHLESCVVCREQWRRWKGISDQIVDHHRNVLESEAQKVNAVRRIESQPVRRRRFTARVVGAISAAAAAVICWVWLFPRHEPPPIVIQHPSAGAPPVTAKGASPSTKAQPVRHRRRIGKHQAAVAAVNPGFVPLPYSNDALPINDATVVRVELPIEELWLSGVMIEGGYKEGTVQADVLVGIDGLPRGIRFIQ